MAMCWEEQGPVSRVSLLGMIDHRQNQQLSFVKASFLLPHFLSPFLCLPLSPRSLLLTSWEIPSAGKETWSLAVPLPPLPSPSPHLFTSTPPAGFCTLPGPSRDPPISPDSLQAGLTLEFKVLLQLLLFFKRKLGYWVRAKSTWGKGRGQGGWHR